MVATFGTLQHGAVFGFVAPSAVAPAAQAITARSVSVDPLAVSRLGDILPLVLERYGYASDDDEPTSLEHRRPETSRPDAARGRRRVG